MFHQRVYKTDPLANLLALLNPLPLPAPVRNLMNTVSQNHYGQGLSTTLNLYHRDPGIALVPTIGNWRVS